MEMDVVDINLEEGEGFCIGEYENNGCTVIFDNVKERISSDIDFAKTKAAICSVVIFIGELDVSYQYSIGKKIVFEISCLEVECRLKNRNVCKKIVTSSEWEGYSISLPEFGGDISEWKSLKEIKFLLKREDTSGGKIEIK